MEYDNVVDVLQGTRATLLERTSLSKTISINYTYHTPASPAKTPATETKQ